MQIYQAKTNMQMNKNKKNKNKMGKKTSHD